MGSSIAIYNMNFFK